MPLRWGRVTSLPGAWWDVGAFCEGGGAAHARGRLCGLPGAVSEPAEFAVTVEVIAAPPSRASFRPSLVAMEPSLERLPFAPCPGCSLSRRARSAVWTWRLAPSREPASPWSLRRGGPEVARRVWVRGVRGTGRPRGAEHSGVFVCPPGAATSTAALDLHRLSPAPPLPDLRHLPVTRGTSP